VQIPPPVQKPSSRGTRGTDIEYNAPHRTSRIPGIPWNRHGLNTRLFSLLSENCKILNHHDDGETTFQLCDRELSNPLLSHHESSPPPQKPPCFWGSTRFLNGTTIQEHRPRSNTDAQPQVDS
jgi:hypothetical protein